MATAMGRAVIETTASCSSSVKLSSHETVFSRLSTQYIDFCISQDDQDDPITIQDTYIHTYITWIFFFFNPVMNLHKFSCF